ncbi:DUF1707 SHOCT-like domain-containing protein [Actinoplanes couchii]|uniref:DUF1707 domain-containing protein n=1 Tax=Actinoplanes couchii TaxID=403638 RepID=A0ABQ3X1F1_9ACTN|nr:DUF1707 domain-containing protein [Actinoplanes couchii]MDR6316724.1 hypothetical protein [Actinoplanes couchii]GID52332.1 hypothetical protein Aco03nite_007360 [Actinoplanes couchii]
MGSPVPAPISDGDRERVSELLQQACGDGRITLEEFSVRVGAAWAASTDIELARATQGLAPLSVVGTARTVEKVVTVLSERKRRGRWRLRSGRLKVFTLLGSTKLDLREVITGEDVIEIEGSCLFGEFVVIVPEGVEVELSGMNALSSEELRLAAVPRLPGTPVVRVRVDAWFSSVEVRSKKPGDTTVRDWISENLGL